MSGGSTCTVCPVDTYTEVTSTATSCTPCADGLSTNGATGQSACVGELHQTQVYSKSNIFTLYRTENITDEKREGGLCSRI